jgi:transcriptional regulator with XRE-family HTH domain
MPSTRRRIRSSVALLRSELGLYQKQFADLLGCSTESIKSIELGRLKLSESLALRISAETGVDSQWLLRNGYYPILPSVEAVYLDPEKQWNVYNKKTFERFQAAKQSQGSVFAPNIKKDQFVGMLDHVKLRSIIQSAHKRGLFQVARFKLGQFLKEFEEEFGSDPETFAPPADFAQRDAAVIEFVERELESARQWLKPQDETPPKKPRRRGRAGGKDQQD